MDIRLKLISFPERGNNLFEAGTCGLGVDSFWLSPLDAVLSDMGVCCMIEVADISDLTHEASRSTRINNRLSLAAWPTFIKTLAIAFLFFPNA
jgi:hypothetical protein